MSKLEEIITRFGGLQCGKHSEGDGYACAHEA